jgi:hypothetical protein
MPSVTDSYADASKLNEQLGTEVAGGELVNENDLGTVAEFNGTSSDIDFGSPTEVDNTFDGGGTVMFWMYANTSATTQDIVSKHERIGGWNMNVRDDGTFAFFHNFSALNIQYKANIKLKQWMHVAVTYNNDSTSDNGKIYINGDDVGFQSLGPPTGTRTSDAARSLNVGNLGDSSRFFDGRVAELRIYKGDILSASTISGLAKAGIEPSETVDLHAPLDGDANDDSGNGNNGIAT